MGVRFFCRLTRAGSGFGGGPLRRVHGAGGALLQVQPREADGAHQDLLEPVQRHQGVFVWVFVVCMRVVVL